MADDSPEWRSPITVAGVYDGIPMERYHGPDEICPGPSVSSSGLRKIESESAYHYWYSSPLNPACPEPEEKPHLQLGKCLHDLLEFRDAAWKRWHVLPKGFSEHHSTKFKDAIVERDAAVAAGKSCIRHDDALKAAQMAERVLTHPRAQLMFQAGKHEPTLAWKDEETGIWCRVRPDFLPNRRAWIPDYKSTKSAHPDDFARSVNEYGYHQAAALYLTGIRALFGERPKGFLFVAQESTEPFVTELYQLDEDAIAWGHVLNRRALRKLADCIEKDRWPTYGNEVNLIGLPFWRHKQLEEQVKIGALDVPGTEGYD